jgi:RNA polymerase sigma factor (sigma-70 family)
LIELVPPEDSVVAELAEFSFRCARKWGTSVEDAHDVAQEAMLRYFSSWRGVREPRTWLSVVVRRLCHLLKQRRVQSEAARLALAEHLEVTSAPAAETRTEARRLMSKARAQDREILLLSAAGFTHREIAAKIACHEKSVGVLLQRAAKRLLRGTKKAVCVRKATVRAK